MASFFDAFDNFESVIASRLAGTIEDIVSSDSESILLKVKSHRLTHVSNSKEGNFLLSGGGTESSGENGFTEHLYYFI